MPKLDLAAEPIMKDVNYAEPCVCVLKMREFGEKERFDRWCIKHHHWLNGAQAKSVIEEMVKANAQT